MVQNYMDWKNIEDYDDLPDEVMRDKAKWVEPVENLFQLESCDYWCERVGRRSNAMKWTKHASCQWMSRVNLLFATSVMPGRNWVHVADNEMNEGKTHHYVMNEKGEILDPQGITFDFKVEDYQKTFKPEMVSNNKQMIDAVMWYRIDYESALNDDMNEWKDDEWDEYFSNILDVDV